MVYYIPCTWYIISVRQNAVRTSLDIPGLLLVFVLCKIKSFKTIKSYICSYLVSFENFHFFQFLAKIDHK